MHDPIPSYDELLRNLEEAGVEQRETERWLDEAIMEHAIRVAVLAELRGRTVPARHQTRHERLCAVGASEVGYWDGEVEKARGKAVERARYAERLRVMALMHPEREPRGMHLQIVRGTHHARLIQDWEAALRGAAASGEWARRIAEASEGDPGEAGEMDIPVDQKRVFDAYR